MDVAAHPYPRLWWTKRLFIAAVVLLILLTISRLLWGWYAHRQLQHELDLITVAGEPISRAQIQTPAVPDAQNAALLWQQAAAAVNDDVETPSQSNLAEPSYPPHSAEWNRLLRTGVNGNAKALSLARQATQKSRSSWRTPPPLPIINIPNWEGERNLTSLIGDAAQYSHEQGNDAEAIRRIQEVRHLADSIKTRPDSISYLTATGIEDFALDRVLLIAPDLQIAGNESVATTGPSGITPASRRQVQALIQELWSASQPNSDMHRTLNDERISDLETFASAEGSSPLLRPMYDLDAARALQWRAILFRAADAPNWPAASKIVDAIPAEPARSAKRSGSSRPLPRYSRWISQQLFFRTMSDLEFRYRRERQFAAVALAARLYFLDHQAWPGSLDELTPDYLPGKTFDGLAPDGRPLGYLLAKTDRGIRPIVYGVEPNYNMLTAPTADLPSTPCYFYTRGHWQIRDLSRWYPPPATQATQPSP